MGFGSYDESEQREQDFGSEDEDEEAAVNVHKAEFTGEMSVDTTASTEDLISGLAEMKSEDD